MADVPVQGSKRAAFHVAHAMMWVGVVAFFVSALVLSVWIAAYGIACGDVEVGDGVERAWIALICVWIMSIAVTLSFGAAAFAVMRRWL